MADVIDMANDRAELDLSLAIKRAAKPAGPMLWPQRVCHNCGEPLEDGNALFCAYVAPGEDRPACAIDFWRRHGGGA